MKLLNLIKLFDDVSRSTINENGDELIDSNVIDQIVANIGVLFVKLCGKGRKDIVIWMDNLMKENRPYINLYTACRGACQKAFQESCINGFKDVAEWLLSVDKSINIYVNDNKIFRYACKNGHINVVEWLYYASLDSVKIDIRAKNDYAFKKCCENNHKNIAEYLCTLCPEYEIICHCRNYIGYKINNMKSTLKQIYEKNDMNRLNMLYLNIPLTKCDDRSYINSCPICMSDDETKFVQFECYHSVCAMCFVSIDKCYYRCKNKIDLKKVNLIKID